MKRAIWIAKKQTLKNKLPIASIIVWKNFEIGIGLNLKKFNYHYLAHAELTALKQASFYISNRLMKNSTLYTTLMPCYICMSLIYIFKIKYIVYGTDHKKYNINKNLINKIKIKGGILKNYCKNLLNNFYIQ